MFSLYIFNFCYIFSDYYNFIHVQVYIYFILISIRKIIISIIFISLYETRGISFAIIALIFVCKLSIDIRVEDRVTEL